MLWVQLPDDTDIATVRSVALEAGIVFGQGKAFFPGPLPGVFVRLNCAKADEEQLNFAIRRLGELLSA